MAKITVFARGRDVTNLTIVPQNVAADGTLSPQSTSVLTGLLDNVTIDTNPEQVEISALDAVRQQMYILKEANSVTLTEILQAGGSSPNVLRAFANNYDVGQFTATQGGKTWAFYGRRGQYTEQWDKGRLTGRLTLTMLDSGGANPTLS